MPGSGGLPSMSDEELVQLAEAIAKALGSDNGNTAEGRTQCSRALEAAAGGIRVFRNWLAYQQGRDPRGFWSLPVGNQGTLADSIRRVVQSVEGSTADREEQRDLLLRFLGFFRRAYIGREYLRD